jgi:hypothetical protein
MTLERILSQARRPALAGLAVIVAGLIAAGLADVQPASAQYWGGGDR